MLKKIIVSPDSFKGTMSSIEVCNIIENAVKNIDPEIIVHKIPAADGGEGTVDAFLTAAGGEKVYCTVKDPLNRDIEAFYGILPDRTAVIEMAAASGLPLIEGKENPLQATTYGTGQLILNAIDKGCKKIIIGIGGSATVDGGIGAVSAIGARFLNKAGNEVSLNGSGLRDIEYIDVSGLDPRIKTCSTTVACDVTNPLYGTDGAAYVFGPQKGADQAMVMQLDEGLKHYAEIINNQFGIDVQKVSGAGAAGGLGAALHVFLGAEMKPGIGTLLDAAGFDEALKDADLVITGEGRIDGQSLKGKVPVGIAERAAKYGVPVIAVVGDIGEGIEEVYKHGISAVFSINRRAVPFEIARKTCRQDLQATVEDIVKFAELL